MLKQKQVTQKIIKIMKKNTEDKENKTISLSLGLYPGILFGVRTYAYENITQYVIYLPFIDFLIEIKN